jgi:arylsulfatase A-like enzyme
MNILLILTDDHAAWALGHAGCAEIHTPNLDRLAARGTRYTNAVTPSPVCSPARACLMTGRMPSEHGIHDWLQEYDPEIGDRDWLAGIETLPEWYQQRGYHTGLSGKWHLGFHEGAPPGFDWAFGMDRKINSHNGPIDYFLNGEKLNLEGNRSRHITDHALRFLEERPDDRPFFLNIGYFATHSPFMENKHDPETVNLYRDATFPDLPRLAPHPWRKPENGIPGDSFDEEEARKRWRGYYAAVTEIDREIGRVIDALEARGLLEDTLILYSADHGLCLGHHGVWGKGNGTRPLNFYEESLRVPLIIAGPGMEPGGIVDTPVSHLETYRFLTTDHAEITDETHHSKGIFDSRDSRDSLLSSATFHEYGDSRAIRTPQYKLIRRYHHGPDELYDLTKDPHERKNVIEDPTYSQVVAEMDAAQDAFFESHSRDSCDGRRVAALPRHNDHEAWRDGLRDR